MLAHAVPPRTDAGVPHRLDRYGVQPAQRGAEGSRLEDRQRARGERLAGEPLHHDHRRRAVLAAQRPWREAGRVLGEEREDGPLPLGLRLVVGDELLADLPLADRHGVGGRLHRATVAALASDACASPSSAGTARSHSSWLPCWSRRATRSRLSSATPTTSPTWRRPAPPPRLVRRGRRHRGPRRAARAARTRSSGPPAPAGVRPERTDAVDRDAAIRSMDAAVAAGVSRYVMVSFSGATADHLVPEDDPFRRYQDAKIAADEHLRGTELDWTVLGPGALTTEPVRRPRQPRRLLPQRRRVAARAGRPGGRRGPRRRPRLAQDPRLRRRRGADRRVAGQPLRSTEPTRSSSSSSSRSRSSLPSTTSCATRTR